jgi:hypothetical protein
MAPPVFIRNALPKFATGLGTPITYDKGHNLTGAAIERNPQPAFLTFVPDKRPQFIQFQHIIALRR